MSSVVKNGLPPRPPATLPVRYATAVTGSSAASTSTPSNTSGASTLTSNGTQSIGPLSSTIHSSLHDAASSSPSLTQASASGPSPLLSSASASGVAADDSSHSQVQSPEVSEAIPPSSASQQTVPQAALATGEYFFFHNPFVKVNANYLIIRNCYLTTGNFYLFIKC